MKLLLADDDAFLLDMYATKFTEAGHEIVTAGNGEQALAKLRQGESFDGIVLDMVMPGVTGLDLLAAIKKEKLGGKAKCIVLSNQGQESDMEAAKKAGAVGYIIKAEHVPSKVVEKVIHLLS